MPKLSALNQSTANQLKRIQAKLAYWERQYTRMKSIERKQDTRRKIQLGGLIKKAGLDGEATAVLYGLLLEAVEKLEHPEDGHRARQHWRIRGDIALTQESKGHSDCQF